MPNKFMLCYVMLCYTGKYFTYHSNIYIKGSSHFYAKVQTDFYDAYSHIKSQGPKMRIFWIVLGKQHENSYICCIYIFYARI